MTEKERLLGCLKAIEDFLCEKEPRVGDALFVVECIKMNMEGLQLYDPARSDPRVGNEAQPASVELTQEVDTAKDESKQDQRLK